MHCFTRSTFAFAAPDARQIHRTERALAVELGGGGDFVTGLNEFQQKIGCFGALATVLTTVHSQYNTRYI